MYGWVTYGCTHGAYVQANMGWPMCVHTFVDGNFFLPRTVHWLTQFLLMAFSLACLCDFLKQHLKTLFFVCWAQRGVTLWQIYSNHQVLFMEHEQLLILFTANKRQWLGQTLWSYIPPLYQPHVLFSSRIGILMHPPVCHAHKLWRETHIGNTRYTRACTKMCLELRHIQNCWGERQGN